MTSSQTVTTLPADDVTLAAQWAQRVQNGIFSAAVLGTGVIRVTGKSGDVPIAYPRIKSLDALSELAPDERWAVRMTEAILTESWIVGRRVVTTHIEAGSMSPTVTDVTTFDPTIETMIVLSATAGG